MQQGGCTWVSSTAASSAISLHMRRKAGPISFQGNAACDQSKLERLGGAGESEKSIPGLPDCRSRSSVITKILEKPAPLRDAEASEMTYQTGATRKNGSRNDARAVVAVSRPARRPSTARMARGDSW